MIKLWILPLFAACVVSSLSACAEQAPPSTAELAKDRVILAGQTLILENHQQRCALRKPDQSLLQLEIPWPCKFSPDRKGLPRVEAVSDNELIILVYHSQAEPEPSRSCTSQYQAVRQIQGRLETSIVAQSSFCMGGVIDQKHFVGLFP
ncbi:hypothetical protein [Pseudomonas mucidolens]|uniref:Lipoprotein n=1 Tax=Pseudomonas mucidolens TaxID=46679 RepID=A0A1H2NV40_9PSED|nr:hypothetical protein [Pseudomonas mucidolens]SDV09280.1 hypothetical protein SAMN05216202_4761 [Pseudomonas mucidolens]SQH37424.1 Uncharacterised protein [Pseudomonas mucidolens]